MRVDLGRRHVTVAQQFLHSADVVACLQQMCREGVAESVRRDRLLDTGLSSRVANLTLHALLMDVMPPAHT